MENIPNYIIVLGVGGILLLVYYIWLYFILRGESKKNQKKDDILQIKTKFANNNELQESDISSIMEELDNQSSSNALLDSFKESDTNKPKQNEKFKVIKNHKPPKKESS
jgi:hypothetical protein